MTRSQTHSRTTVVFSPSTSAAVKARLSHNDDLYCQMCGLTPGDIDPFTGRKVRLHVGHIIDKSLGGKDEISNLRTLCSTCNKAAKNLTGEKPTATWLLSQVRRAGQQEQKAVFEWLSRKFDKEE